jgi:hypothetical protein
MSACQPVKDCGATAVKFQLRRATEHEWAIKDPILRCGEPGCGYYVVIALKIRRMAFILGQNWII